MTRSELHRAVARATGESLGTIARMGFGPLCTTVEEREPLLVDWDRVDAQRLRLLPLRQRRRSAVA